MRKTLIIGTTLLVLSIEQLASASAVSDLPYYESSTIVEEGTYIDNIDNEPMDRLEIGKMIAKELANETFKMNRMATRAKAIGMFKRFLGVQDKQPKTEYLLDEFTHEEPMHPPADQSSKILNESRNPIMDVPLINQYPLLPSGCEVVALAMALQYYGVDVDITTLADNMIYDDVPIIRDRNRVILQWGDPEVGYVGDPYGLGITINPNPLKKLADQYRPSIALYGEDFSVIENYVNEGKPTIVWFTLNYEMPIHRTWRTDKGKEVFAPRPLHAITVTGVDDTYVYFNDSDANKKNVKLAKDHFIQVYEAMGQRALVIE